MSNSSPYADQAQVSLLVTDNKTLMQTMKKVIKSL